VQLSGYGSICLCHHIVTKNYVCYAINMPDVFLERFAIETAKRSGGGFRRPPRRRRRNLFRR
jgi:hypothetical protein